MNAAVNAGLHAGFWRRVAAYLVDGLILIVPNVALVFLFGKDSLLLTIAQLGLTLAYFAAFHSSGWQATPGKRVFGIKVTDKAGERINLPHAIGRHLASLLSGLILGIGFLMAAFTRRKQALHDLLCGTLVVRAQATEEETVNGSGTMKVTGGVWAVAILLFFIPFVLGMAAAITIPAFQDYTMRSKMVEVVRLTRSAGSAVEEALVAGRPVTPGPVQAFVNMESLVIRPDGRVVAKLVPGVGNGGTVVWTPALANGAVAWKCTSPDVPKKWLPMECRG